MPDQKRAFRFRPVYLVSGGTTFPFLLIWSFFFSNHSLPLPFFVVLCFFLGLCLSEMETCSTKNDHISNLWRKKLLRFSLWNVSPVKQFLLNLQIKRYLISSDKNLLSDFLHLHYYLHQRNYLHPHFYPQEPMCWQMVDHMWELSILFFSWNCNRIDKLTAYKIDAVEYGSRMSFRCFNFHTFRLTIHRIYVQFILCQEDHSCGYYWLMYKWTPASITFHIFTYFENS